VAKNIIFRGSGDPNYFDAGGDILGGEPKIYDFAWGVQNPVIHYELFSSNIFEVSEKETNKHYASLQNYQSEIAI